MLSGKNILVTGSSSGIGRQIAIDIGLNKGNPILTGRNVEKLIEICNIIKMSDADVTYHQVELRNESEITGLAKSLPNLSGLVINAGIIDYTPIKYISKAKIEDIFQVNFVSNIILIKKLLEYKKIDNNASIVFIGSIASKLGIPGTSLYAASKAALTTFAKVLAIELSPQKIRVNTLSPGLVTTDLTDKIAGIKSDGLERNKNYPLGWGSTYNVSNHVIFLLSDKSEWMTGSDITIDGGFTLT